MTSVLSVFASVRSVASSTQMRSCDSPACGPFVNPEATGVRGGGGWVVFDGPLSCVFVCLSSTLNIVHFMSLHANMSSLSGPKTSDWSGGEKKKKKDMYSLLQEVFIFRNI